MYQGEGGSVETQNREAVVEVRRGTSVSAGLGKPEKGGRGPPHLFPLSTSSLFFQPIELVL